MRWHFHAGVSEAKTSTPTRLSRGGGGRAWPGPHLRQRRSPRQRQHPPPQVFSPNLFAPQQASSLRACHRRETAPAPRCPPWQIRETTPSNCAAHRQSAHARPFFSRSIHNVFISRLSCLSFFLLRNVSFFPSLYFFSFSVSLMSFFSLSHRVFQPPVLSHSSHAPSLLSLFTSLNGFDASRTHLRRHFHQRFFA